MPWARSEEERRQLLGALSSKVTESLRGAARARQSRRPVQNSRGPAIPKKKTGRTWVPSTAFWLPYEGYVGDG